MQPEEVNAAIRKSDELNRIAVHRSKDEVAAAKVVENRILDYKQAEYNAELARSKQEQAQEVLDKAFQNV